MIPLIDLQAQYRSVGSEIETAVTQVLRSGQYALGPEVEAFENEFAEYCGTKFGVGVNSGTSALYLALRAIGIGPGDEVVTVPFTFTSTVSEVIKTGASVRFVDISPDSFTLNPSDLARTITDRTKAIIPVHLFGQPANMDPILDIAQAHGLSVIEDAAQAHGARYKGRPVGSLGTLSCFSFYPSKNLSACGEGGIVCTDDHELAEKIKKLRNWGSIEYGNYTAMGGNYRLDAIQAAVLRVKLRHLDDWNKSRHIVSEQYDQLLGNLALTTPPTMPYSTHAHHIYAIRVATRDAILKTLNRTNIGASVHYRNPIHLLPSYRELGYSRGQMPESERAAEEVISLPIFPELSTEAIVTVAETIADALVTNKT